LIPDVEGQYYFISDSDGEDIPFNNGGIITTKKGYVALFVSDTAPEGVARYKAEMQIERIYSEINDSDSIINDNPFVYNFRPDGLLS
jgi:hypothetical protein